MSLLLTKPLFSQNNCQSATEIIYSDSIDALHYDIHLTEIDLTTKTIKGYTKVQLKPGLDGLTEIKLELTSLNIDSIFVGNTPVSIFSYSDPILSIPLESPIMSSDTLEIRVYYQGSPFVDPSGWGGFHFSGNYAFNLGVGFDAIPHNLGKAWFPCIDDFRDRALYDVYLTIPSQMSAISGGLLSEITDHGNNTSTWHWKTQYSLPTYLISASIGTYSLVSDQFQGISKEVPITYYCRPSDTLKVAGTFVHMKDILQAYETHFGPYPFERVGYTATAEGAMEHAANISYPYSGWNGNTSNEWWYAHELSHMWFGDMVTCASAEDMWLNEGWAVWCESLYMEELYGEEVSREYLRLKLKNVILQSHIKDGGYFAVYGIPQTITYGNTVYEKGCQVTHTLRHYLGDELFFSGIKAYLQQYAFKPASTCDLRDFLSSYTGVDLNDFFNAWVFSPGFLNFSIGHMKVQEVSNGFDVNVSVRQRLKEATEYANSNHLELTFIGANWQEFTDTFIFSGAIGEKTFHLPFEPIEVIPDMNEKISDAALSFRSVIKSPGEIDFTDTYARLITSSVTDSAWVRITHNWAAPDDFNTAVQGVSISNARFWKVEGNFPAGFNARGKFFYNKSNLDNTLITSSNDSVIILYRKDDQNDWSRPAFSRIGTNNIGFLTVDTLFRGEYTVAVIDKTYGLNEPGKNPGFGMNIYPNPTQGECTVQVSIPETVLLCVFDTLGKKVDEFPLTAGHYTRNWSKRNQEAGIYFFRMFSTSGTEIMARKVIFN
ncbi:MAG: T9SS type A sorting domain-containing protein [Bacteroidales bacterium]|nr:T9SS type A sorting domain-containing protein [Bacteroidales bacterium]